MRSRYQTCSANGIEIAYECRGNGPAVVLLHGLGCGRRMWTRQIHALKSYYRVYALDQRGHGNSTAPDSPDCYSPDHLVADLAAFLDAVRIDRCHLVGFSLGGGPALSFALRYPERVFSLVLSDVGSGSETSALAQDDSHPWLLTGRNKGMDALVSSMLEHDFFRDYATSSERARRHLCMLLHETPLHGLLFTFSQVNQKRQSILSMGKQLKALRVPTLVTRGELDYSCEASTNFLAEMVSDATKVLISGAGHMLPLEAPDRFGRALISYFSEHPDAAGALA